MRTSSILTPAILATAVFTSVACAAQDSNENTPSSASNLIANPITPRKNRLIVVDEGSTAECRIQKHSVTESLRAVCGEDNIYHAFSLKDDKAFAKRGFGDSVQQTADGDVTATIETYKNTGAEFFVLSETGEKRPSGLPKMLRTSFVEADEVAIMLALSDLSYTKGSIDNPKIYRSEKQAFLEELTSLRNGENPQTNYTGKDIRELVLKTTTDSELDNIAANLAHNSKDEEHNKVDRTIAQFEIALRAIGDFKGKIIARKLANEVDKPIMIAGTPASEFKSMPTLRVQRLSMDPPTTPALNTGDVPKIQP